MSDLISSPIEQAPKIYDPDYIERHLRDQQEDIKRLFNIMNTFGACHGNEIGWTQASAVQNTWYDVVDSDVFDGELSNVLHDGTGILTVTRAGVYRALIETAHEGAATADHIQHGIKVNNTVQAVGITHSLLSGANLEASMTSFAFLKLAVGDTVNVVIRTTDATTPDIEVDHVALALVMQTD